MSDLNKEALDVWGGLKPMIDQEISSRTQGMVQRRKAKVTTAPSLATNTIGVTEAFGDEMFLPFVTNMISAKVGDFVWIEWMYGATNAFVSSFAAVDDKNFTVAGTLDVVPRRCYATLSSAGWYRAFSFDYSSGAAVDIVVGVGTATVHKVSLMFPSVAYAKFVDETSDGPTTVFDKIRFIANSSLNKCYVDIHFNEGGTRTVYVNAIPHGSFYYTINSSNLTAVAASPSGETIVTEYSFAADTNVARAYFTPTFSGTANPTVNTINCFYSIKDNVMYAGGRFNLASFTSGGTTVAFTLPVSLGSADRSTETIGTMFTTTKTLQLRWDGSVVYITDAGGNYSGGLLNTGYWSFQIVAPIYN